MYRELELNGAAPLSFQTEDFILRFSVPKVTEQLIGNPDRLREKLIEKAKENGDKLRKQNYYIVLNSLESIYFPIRINKICRY